MSCWIRTSQFKSSWGFDKRMVVRFLLPFSEVIAMYQAVFYEVGHDDDDKFDISMKRVKRRLMKCSTESEKTEDMFE